ncbi:unnamed protein product [Parajaminaea phylloscopi]
MFSTYAPLVLMTATLAIGNQVAAAAASSYLAKTPAIVEASDDPPRLGDLRHSHSVPREYPRPVGKQKRDSQQDAPQMLHLYYDSIRDQEPDHILSGMLDAALKQQDEILLSMQERPVALVSEH